jgi:hypothetical protein
MIAVGEDPFAIHLLIQSADKLLIDLSKKTGRDIPFKWGDLIKPEYKDAVIATFRETSNFFKHADKDHDATLHVGEVAQGNILQLGICIVNYAALFGEWTDHMKLLFGTAKFVFPDSFVRPDEREQFEVTSFATFKNMTLAEFLSGWWNDPLVKKYALPNLDREKAEDLQDTQPLYRMRLSDIPKA